MELPQPRPFGTQGSMSTHDFLSLYSPVQDPIPSHGNYLKTHDFLQPLEGKNSGKEENTVEITTAEKPPPPTPPPSDEHLILPGGMGTYSISHISYSNQRVPKPEGDIFAVAQASSSTEKNEENSNCSSYSGSGFTLWEESAMKKGKTRKENIAGDRHVTRGDLTEKVGAGKCTDQKPNTPRSKHSATEQRRRSKINDRFQMLRDLIPHSDQKRDKASFLLEVTEYIQYLQEKVHKYEGSYQEWNQEPELMPWGNSHKPTEAFVDQSRATNSGSGPPVMFAAKFEENNIDVSPNNAENGQNAVEYNMSTVTTLKAIDHHSRLTNMAVPHVPLMPNIFNPGGSGSAISPFPDKMASDCAVASKNLKEQEMSIESGTISISSVYSQGLLNTLKQALQSSGVDLSQASISVQIDLRNPADSRPTASTSAVKDNEIPPRNPLMAHSGGASSRGESDRAQKRLKAS